MAMQRRLHILLDEPTAAKARGTSVATIVREAIDKALPADLERKRSGAPDPRGEADRGAGDGRGAQAGARGDPRQPLSRRRVILLDTTILIYARGGPHPLRERCRRVFEAAIGGVVDARTTTFVIQEYAHVRARRHGREDAAARAGEFAATLAPLLATEEQHVEDALALYARHDGLGAFDALLAATARAADATLVSADRVFAAVKGLRHVDPATPALDALLGG